MTNDEKHLRTALQIILDLTCNDLLSYEQTCKEIERHAALALGFPPPIHTKVARVGTLA